jgi:opacity protein-like surface antigen
MMMKKSLVIMLTCSALITSFTATATDDELYKFVGFSLTQYDNLANLDLSHTEIDLVPEVIFGLGKKYQLNNGWQLATEISMHYAKAHFSGLVKNDSVSNMTQGQQSFSGNYEALGLWATSRFNYVGLSDNISPFIELGVGVVQTNHGTLFGEEKNQGIAYKAITGLEFEVAKDMTFSFGIGFSDNDNNL